MVLPLATNARRWAFHSRSRKDEGRSLGTTGLSQSVRVSVVEALGVWEGLQRTAWEPLAGQCGCGLHNMREVFRDVQCRISALTTGADLWEVSAPGIQKQISSDADHADGRPASRSFNRQGGLVGRYRDASQSRHHS
jgi:hypothetical protein